MNEVLQKYFLYLLGKRDYSSGVLVKKALIKGYLEEEIKPVMIWLETKNFVNDVRLAENLVENYKARKGKFWIQQKLSQKFISREIIAKVMEYEETQPAEKLKEKVCRKYKIENWQEIEPATKMKIVGFLSRNGYGNSFEILEKWVNKE